MFLCPAENRATAMPMPAATFTPPAGWHTAADRAHEIGPGIICGNCGRCQRCGQAVGSAA